MDTITVSSEGGAAVPLDFRDGTRGGTRGSALPRAEFRARWFKLRTGDWLDAAAGVLNAGAAGRIALPGFPEGKANSENDLALKLAFDPGAINRKPALDPGIGQAQASRMKTNEKQFSVNCATAQGGNRHTPANRLKEAGTHLAGIFRTRGRARSPLRAGDGPAARRGLRALPCSLSSFPSWCEVFGLEPGPLSEGAAR